MNIWPQPSAVSRLRGLGHNPRLSPGSAASATTDERYPGTRRTLQGEFELVVYDATDLVLTGEAKWQNGLVDTDALTQFEGTVRHVPGYGPETRLVLYSREGFTPRLEWRARASGVMLRTVDDLYA